MYGHRFNIAFKNRIQGDIYRLEIWEKDSTDSALTELTGAEIPFTSSHQNSDVDLLNPIQSVELTFAFITDGSITIEDFYSDDDERFRADFYFESDENGGGTEQLLYTGYLIQDGATEPLTDRKHVITLKATDNLALLKNVRWNETGSEYQGQHALGYYIRNCLKQTGLYSHDSIIDQSLPLRLYNNLFENTTDDRGDDPEADPFAETILNAEMFQNSDTTWLDCYAVLEQVLKSLNATLIQANGAWNVIRIPEYGYFTAGEIEGVQYVYNGSGTDVDPIALEPLVEIDRGGTIEPFAEDQAKSIQRPYRYIKDTFNYNTPDNLIKNLDLQELGTYRGEFTDGDNTVKEYDLPDWYLTPSTGAGDYDYWVRVVYDENDIEIDRYVVVEHSTDSVIAEILSTGVYVNQNDRIQVSFEFRTEDSQTGPGNVVWHVTIDPGGTTYKLNQNNGTEIDGTWDTSGGIVYSYSGDINLNEWQSISVDSLNIPVDGWLNIWLTQAKTGGGKTFIRNINASFTAFINETTEIVGQTHTDTGASTIKAIKEEDVFIDDSPRNFIPGTLLTDLVTSFGSALPGNPSVYYVTKTTLWHRVDSVEALRLGNIITQERLKLNYTARTIVEGTFKPLRYDTDKFISPLTLFQFGASFPEFDGKFFIAASMETDYMNCTFRAKLVEIFKDDEDDFTDEYLFKYLFNTE